MHSEGHIVAHLHITEIEHEHPGVNVSEDHDQVAHTTCHNSGFKQLPHRNQCALWTPSTAALLEPCESESSMESSVVVHTAICESPKPNGNCKSGDDGIMQICVNNHRTGCDEDPGNNISIKVNGLSLGDVRGEGGKQRIIGVDEANNPKRRVGRSKRSGSDYLGECKLLQLFAVCMLEVWLVCMQAPAELL